jgi:glycosyltransferase involved in cell wall biosynthesis
MRVLFCIRSNYLKSIAGDSIQLLTMAKFLRDKGIKIDINTGEIKDYSSYDIIHLFNLTRVSETYKYYKIAKSSKKNVVITPIYWNLEKYYLYAKNEIHFAMWQANKLIRSEIINGCNMIYPASIKEMNLIKKEFGENNPCTVVYNCVDTDIFNKKTEINDHYEPFILCAARVCPRKNQLILAEICKDLGEKLVLVGDVNNKEYLKNCLKLQNTMHMGYLEKEDLIEFYQNARLHILCSFLETPGLSNLEAGAMGCNIISTSEGSTEEYFGNLALYCNPYDEGDIYNTVKMGLRENNQPALKEHIHKNFNLKKCLQPLYESYFKL